MRSFEEIHPLYSTYVELTPYQFASNRPIDGIDLDGLEWKSSKRWLDKVSLEDLKKSYGTALIYMSKTLLGFEFGRREAQAWEAKQGISYVDLYRERIPRMQEIHHKSGTQLDCADFTIELLIDFAVEYELPIHFKDNYKKERNPTFDNDNFGYTDRNGTFHELKEGDIDGLKEGIRTISAGDLYNIRNYTIKSDFSDLQAGSLIGVKWNLDGDYHSMMAAHIFGAEEGNMVALINATEREGRLVTEPKAYLLDKLKYNEDGVFGQKALETQALEWNFEIFDENYDKK